MSYTNAVMYGAAYASPEGSAPSAMADLATPSFSEAAVYGAMFASHKDGFTSGGLLGYKTLFTGYDGQGVMARVSVGRAVNQGVAAAGRLGSALFDPNSAAHGWMQAMQHADRVGLAGLLGSVSKEAYQDDLTRRFDTMQMGAVRTGADLNTPLNANGPYKVGAYSEINVHKGAYPDGSASMLDSDHLRRRRNALRGRERGNTTVNSKIGRFLRGALGGHEKVSDVIEAGGRVMGITDMSSSGSVLIKGSAGRALGAAVKIGGWLEVAKLATDLAADAVGSSYAALDRTAARMEERLGRGRTMSAAYFNQASATERQRAAYQLQTSDLNPRTQFKGNEAFYLHR